MLNNDTEIPILPDTWGQAIAAGFVTRGMVEILVAPDPIGWRMRGTGYSLDEVRQRYRDHCKRQNQKQERLALE
jgi:hypothetical protein